MPGCLCETFSTCGLLVMYGTNPVGNRAADWQGQVDADARGTLWRGRRSRRSDSLKGQGSIFRWRDDEKEGVVAEDKGCED